MVHYEVFLTASFLKKSFFTYLFLIFVFIKNTLHPTYCVGFVLLIVGSLTPTYFLLLIKKYLG